MNVPDGWRATTLGELGLYLNGRGFKKVEWGSTGRPIIRIQNLTGSSASFNYFDGSVDDRNVARPGDLLMSWAATLGAYIWPGPEGLVNQHIFKVQSFIDQRFHKFLLDEKLAELMRRTHGSGMVHVTRGQFESLPVVVPPLNEQRRIVEFLEEFLSSLEAGERALRVSEARAEAWFESALRRALSFGRPVSFAEIFESVSLPSTNVEVRTARHEGRWPVVDQGVEGHGLRSDDVRAVYFGQLPVVLFGDHTRRVKIVHEEFAVGGSGVKILRPVPGVEVEFAYWAARSIALPGRGYGRHFALLRSSEFRLGPSDFQRAVISEMSDASDSLRATVRAVEQARRRAAALRRALLKAAFSGQLTGRSSDLDRAEELVA